MFTFKILRKNNIILRIFLLIFIYVWYSKKNIRERNKKILYFISKKQKKRIYLKLLCIKEEYIKDSLDKIDITDII